MYLASESGPRPSQGWGGVGEGTGAYRDSMGDRTRLYLRRWGLRGSMYLSKRIDVNKRKMIFTGCKLKPKKTEKPGSGILSFFHLLRNQPGLGDHTLKLRSRFLTVLPDPR